MISNNNALKSIILLCFIMNIYSECGPGQYKCPDFECCYCPIGTYSYDGNECLYCPPGTYTNFIGSSFCMNCGEGEFSPNYGSTSCYECPYGSWSKSGSSHCYQMVYNYDYNYYYR